MRDDELVVLSRPGLERLEGDARVGRLLRFVVLPIVALVTLASGVDDAFGDVVAWVATCAVAFPYPAWEWVAPPSRRRAELREELEAAITRLQACEDCRAEVPGGRAVRRLVYRIFGPASGDRVLGLFDPALWKALFGKVGRMVLPPAAGRNGYGRSDATSRSGRGPP